MSQGAAAEERPREGCGSVFPHCTHSCKGVFEAAAGQEDTVRALEGAFERLEHFERLERVRPDERTAALGDGDGSVRLAGYFRTPTCQWLDRFEFEVRPTREDGTTEVAAFGRSTSFVCGGCCPAPVRWLFCWMQCYGDAGLNRKNLQKVRDEMAEGGVHATFTVLYSSC